MKDKAVAYMSKNNIHLTKYAFCKKGGLFDQMPLKAQEGLLPRKSNLPASKYGGYNKPSVSYFVLTRYWSGKKTDVVLMPVELRVSERFQAEDAFAKAYARERIGSIYGKTIEKVEFLLAKRILKVNTLLSLDGFEAAIACTSGGGKQIKITSLMSFATDKKIERYIKRLERLVEKTDSNRNYIVDEKYDFVTKQENLELYVLYLEKASDSVYAKRPNMPIETLRNGKARFEQLDVLSQAKVLLNIHTVFGRLSSSGCDLSLIGGVKNAGVPLLSAALSNWKKSYSCVRIIDRSAGGLWESATDNILTLL